MIETLSQLVGKVESENIHTAIRYEPKWPYVTPELIRLCVQAHRPSYMNEVTARQLLMFSYGEYQIMGSVLYELGFRGKLMEFACDETAQLIYFNKFVKLRGIDYSLEQIVTNATLRSRFALRYNGSASVYGNKLLTTYEKSRK